MIARASDAVHASAIGNSYNSSRACAFTSTNDGETVLLSPRIRVLDDKTSFLIVNVKFQINFNSFLLYSKQPIRTVDLLLVKPVHILTLQMYLMLLFHSTHPHNIQELDLYLPKLSIRL